MSDQKERTFYDEGAFYVEETRYKVWHSFDKDNKPVITALTKEHCIHSTRCYLKWLQEGFPETTQYIGELSGKL